MVCPQSSYFFTVLQGFRIIFSMILDRGSSCLRCRLSSVVWTQACCSMKRADVNLPTGFTLVEEESNRYSLSLSHPCSLRIINCRRVCTFSEECLPGGSDDWLQVLVTADLASTFSINPLKIIGTLKVEAICWGAWTAGEEWINLCNKWWIACHSVQNNSDKLPSRKINFL